MPETLTPGQVAYEAAWRVHQELYPTAHRAPWRELHAAHKRGWECAAQAVLEACASLCPICNAELERCNAKEAP